jgi:hypothetical protein
MEAPFSMHPPLLFAGALAVRAPGPAARPAQTLFQFLLSPADAAFSGLLLLGILDPADEFVAGQRRDVLPGTERSGVGDQRNPQIAWKLVHHTSGQSWVAHRTTVVGRKETLWPTILNVANGSVHGRNDGSRWSLWSRDSVLSIGCRNSVLSVGSIGSLLSIGSVGSAGSVLSIGSFLSIVGVMSGLSWWSVMAWRSKRSIAASGPNR